MIDISAIVTQKILERGDISDHLITLSNLASMCESILECGVRNIVSS
jgi:DNA-binding Xre family transcriptional regulator